jgi:hypothetical protein
MAWAPGVHWRKVLRTSSPSAPGRFKNSSVAASPRWLVSLGIEDFSVIRFAYLPSVDFEHMATPKRPRGTYESKIAYRAERILWRAMWIVPLVIIVIVVVVVAAVH